MDKEQTQMHNIKKEKYLSSIGNHSLNHIFCMSEFLLLLGGKKMSEISVLIHHQQQLQPPGTEK